MLDFPRIRALTIRKMSGLTQASFGQKYRIPKRTIETWEAAFASARRSAPAYVLDLLERVVGEDFMVGNLWRGTGVAAPAYGKAVPCDWAMVTKEDGAGTFVPPENAKEADCVAALLKMYQELTARYF